jgi:hypothetical protein
VNALAVFNSELYVGGNFVALGDGSTSANHIAAWDGSSWSNLTSGSSNGVGNNVNALAVYGSNLLVGGGFTMLGDGTTKTNYVTGWSSASSNFIDPLRSSSQFPTGLSGKVSALAEYNGKVYAGGSFLYPGDGSTSTKNIAAWEGNGVFSSLPCGSSNGVGANVFALTVFNSKLYVGGFFSTLGNGTSAKGIAAWDGTAWSTIPIGSSNGVAGSLNAFAVFNSKLYVGGVFTKLGDGSTSAKYIAAWDGSSWSNLTSGSSNGLDSNVNALAVFNSKLYVGGNFINLGNGTSAKGIAAWDGTNWSTLPIGSSNGVGNVVYALAVFNSKLYVGGNFLTLGDVSTSAKGIAAWDGTDWSTLHIGSSNGVGSTVYALAVFNSKLYVGGNFVALGDGSTTANRIAAWNGTAWSTISLSMNKNGLMGTSVGAFVAVGSRLYMGGEFVGFADRSSSALNFAALGF